MRAALIRFMTRPGVFEVTAAVAVGFALYQAVRAALTGLVETPIHVPEEDGELGSGAIAIGGRVFIWLEPLTAIGVLAILLTIVGLVVFHGRDRLVDERDLECPHCLSAIPVEATVCCYCTRDVPPQVVEPAPAPPEDDAPVDETPALPEPPEPPL